MIIRSSLIKLLIVLALVIVATALLTTSQRNAVRPARREAQDMLELKNLLRAKFMLEDGKNDEALRICSSLLRNSPGSVDVRRVMADAMIAQGNYSTAEGVLRYAITDAPEDAALRRKLATALFFSGRDEQAVQELKKSYSLDPSAPATLLMLYRYYEDRGDTAEQEFYGGKLQQLLNERTMR